MSIFRFTANLSENYRVPKYTLSLHIHGLRRYQYPTPEWYISSSLCTSMNTSLLPRVRSLH